MANSDLREWAVKGAEHRLVEIAAEARAIFAAFPELREPGRGFDAGRGAGVATTQHSLGKRRRKAMSAAARRKIALAQKKRWAEWRKKKKNAKPVYSQESASKEARRRSTRM